MTPSAWSSAADVLDPPPVEAGGKRPVVFELRPDEKRANEMEEISKSLPPSDSLGIRLTKYVPERTVERLNVKQQVALWLNLKDLLYGGAAGGGKSDYLLMGALQYVDVPAYHAIIFRRSYTDLALPGALVERAHEWLDNTDAKWSESHYEWTFPSGASLTFAYLKHANDKYRYQSTDFQYIGFDELTQFPETDFIYLFSRLRKPPSGPLSSVPLRVRAASNPGGVGHKWVKGRYEPQAGNQVQVGPNGRAFVPASLYDNKQNIDVDSYVESLNELDTQTREQLLNGDWSVRPPGSWYFDHDGIDAARDLAINLYDARLGSGKEIPPYQGVLHLCIDWGESTQGYTIWPLESGGIYVPPSEVVATGSEPGEVSGRLLRSGSRFGYPLGSAHYDAAGIQSMRTFAKVARTTEWPHMKTVKIPFNKYKAETAGYIKQLVERTASGEKVRRIAISPQNEELLRQLPELEVDPEDQSVWKKDDDQHGPDALAAGVAKIAAKHRKLVGAHG